VEGEFHTPHWVYIGVFVALAVLTVLELSVNFLEHSEAVRVSALVSLMMAKALLVVLYYMHVRFESRVLQWAVFLPFFAAVFFSVIVMI
jgi:cytochrome c oxidase subunit 4